MSDPNLAFGWMLAPRGLFESRRRHRRRVREFEQRFRERCEVTTVGGVEVATLRPEWRASKNAGESGDQR